MCYTVLLQSLCSFLGCYDGRVYTLDCVNGDIVWCFETDGCSSDNPVKSSPTMHPRTGYIWFGSHDKHVYCIDIYVSIT